MNLNVICSSLEKEKFVNYVERRVDSQRDKEIEEYVNKIIEDVKERGDKALYEYTQKFDNINIKELVIPRERLKKYYENIESEFIKRSEYVIKKISEYQKILKEENKEFISNGIEYKIKFVPVKRVGVYIPGGRYPLVSSVFMNVIPAKVAGVEKIVLSSPPSKDGLPSSYILAAAYMTGVSEVYNIGGAQAIGAMAWGTESISKVDMIVGPGNIYVATAKKIVSAILGIDTIAGPTEIAIIADESARMEYIALDLLAQAEHDPESFCCVFLPEEDMVEELKAEISIHLERISEVNKKVVMKSLQNCFIFIYKDKEEVIDIINKIAPEHLELHTSDERWEKQIFCSGAIFLGKYTPVATGDYVAGPSHTLPTGGSARYSSGLSVRNFLKIVPCIKYTREALELEREIISYFAEMEGLFAHEKSIEIRFEEENIVEGRD